MSTLAVFAFCASRHDMLSCCTLGIMSDSSAKFKACLLHQAPAVLLKNGIKTRLFSKMWDRYSIKPPHAHAFALRVEGDARAAGEPITLHTAYCVEDRRSTELRSPL